VVEATHSLPKFRTIKTAAKIEGDDVVFMADNADNVDQPTLPFNAAQEQ
jgi:hypothetical protein